MTNILLTGSSRGIGAAIAQVLSASDGIRLIGHGTASGIAADFADPAGPRQLWDKALAELGSIDVVINNAGVFEDNPIDLGDDEWVAGWERTMRINLTASAELCRFAVRHWQERQSGGRIVNVASRAAYRGDSPQHWHYAASKAGMVAMTKSIARGYAAQGEPRRREIARRYPARARRRSRGSRQRGCLSRDLRAAIDDRRGDRRERGQLCPLRRSARSTAGG
jgi:NAD(P)-dependent dehydrogenase (short-subunit alcohol dehydrogenase family)